MVKKEISGLQRRFLFNIISVSIGGDGKDGKKGNDSLLKDIKKCDFYFRNESYFGCNPNNGTKLIKKEIVYSNLSSIDFYFTLKKKRIMWFGRWRCRTWWCWCCKWPFGF